MTTKTDADTPAREVLLSLGDLIGILQKDAKSFSYHLDAENRRSVGFRGSVAGHQKQAERDNQIRLSSRYHPTQ